jgi:hypothetical protein
MMVWPNQFEEKVAAFVNDEIDAIDDQKTAAVGRSVEQEEKKRRARRFRRCGRRVSNQEIAVE